MSEQEIHNICEKYNITNYTINPDGSIDVDDGVDLSGKDLIKIPLKFNKVNGWFDCSYNQLTSFGHPSNDVNLLSIQSKYPVILLNFNGILIKFVLNKFTFPSTSIDPSEFMI